MHEESTFEVAAPPKRVWRVWMAAERWPEWNDSIDKLEWTRGESIEEGNRVRISQPGVAPNEWEVIEVEEGRYFAWRTNALGVKTVGSHDVAPLEGDRSLVTITFDQTGFFAPIVARTFGKKIRQFLQMECEGLAARATNAR